MRARLLMAVLVLGAAGALTRADEKPLDRTELDKRIVATVYEAAVAGTDTFNKGAHAECAALYRGTLLAVVPLLDHRPKLQATSKMRLERATKMMAKPADAAFELRTALDEIQNEIAPPKAKDPKEKDPKEKDPKATTLWDRLGGESGVKAVVNKVILAATGDDAKTPFLLKDKKVDLTKFQQAMVAWVSANSDGPTKYNPADLKAALGGAAVSDAEFDALTAITVDQLKKAKVADVDIAAIGKAWEGARKDFVEKKN